MDLNQSDIQGLFHNHVREVNLAYDQGSDIAWARADAKKEIVSFLGLAPYGNEAVRQVREAIKNSSDGFISEHHIRKICLAQAKKAAAMMPILN